MLPFIVFTEEIKLPMYGLMAVIGFTLAICVALNVAKTTKVPLWDVVYAAIFAGIGLVIGAKVIYFVTKIPTLISKFDVFLEHPIESLGFFFGGFVFYGGLIGAVIGLWIYCRMYKMPFAPFVETAIPAIPVMHGIGRIGCLLAGCCYGAEYYGPFAITFPDNELIPELGGVSRFPMQPIEVIYNAILFVVLFVLVKKRILKGVKTLGLYLIAYSVMRFILEFFRGDVIRGHFEGLSTSQWISIILFPIGCYLLLFSGKFAKNKEREVEEYDEK